MGQKAGKEESGRVFCQGDRKEPEACSGNGVKKRTLLKPIEMEKVRVVSKGKSGYNTVKQPFCTVCMRISELLRKIR